MNIPFESTEHRERYEHTVLIIDDEPANLRVMSDYLSSFGLEALIARDGETGIEKAQYARPDLILLDVLMPGMDGFETCRRLKADETLRDVPVIFVTALASTEDKIKGFQLGGVDYITKPFQHDEVLARVTTHLRLRDLTENLEHQVRDRTQELLAANQQLRHTNQELTRQVAERKRAEEALHKINQAYKALSQCNQALVRATEATELLQEVCRIIVEDCGYHLVWIAFAEQDRAKTVRPVAQVGYEEGYLDSVNITWADTESGHDPTGTAIRMGRPVVRQDILTNPDHAPWQAEALERGYASSAALPLMTSEGDVIGALNVFAVQPDAFATEEIVLLTELANDLAYGLVSLRVRAEREQMEQALRESEELHRITIENILDPVFLTDDDGRFIFICPNVLHILGYTVAEIQTMGNISKLLGEDLLSLDELEAKREIHNIEGVIVDKRGRERDFLTTVSRVSIKGGTVLYTCHDITERKWAEEALRASEQRYHSLFEDTPLALWEEDYSQVMAHLEYLNASGITDLRAYFENHPEAAANCAGLVKVLDVNKAAVALVGAGDKEELLAGLPQGFTATSLQAFQEQLVTLAEGGREFESEATYRKLTGEDQVVLLRLTVAPGYEHSLGRVLVSMLDVTERRRAESHREAALQALQKSEERYRTLFEGVPIGLYRASPTGQLLNANLALVQMLGYPDRESLLAEDVASLYPQDGIREQWQVLMKREGIAHGFEVQWHQRDGTVIWIRVTARTVRDANDQVLYYEGGAEDITERKRAEEALRESEERYRTFVQNFQGIAFRGKLDFTPIFFRGAVEKITGYTEGEFLAGKPRWDQVIHPDDLTRIQESAQNIQSIPNQAIEREYRIVRKEGYTRWVHEFIQNVCDASGKPAFIQGALYDVTERKQAEEALARRATQLILINELGTKITAMLDLGQVLTTAAHLVQKNFGYHHVAIFTIELGQSVVMRAKAGSYAALFPDEYRLELGQGMVGWVALHGEKLLANDVAVEPRYIRIRPDLIPTRSELSVPIRIGQDVIGVLDAQSPEYNAFDENDVMVMETVAGQIAVAIEDSRLYEAIQRELDERKRAEEKIRQQNEFLENVLASLTHPFYVVNTSDYTIEMANTAAMLDGLAAGRATCYTHTHHREVPCDGIEYPCPLEEVKRTKQPVTVEHVHQDRDGNRTHVEVHGYPILDRDGNVVQVIKYILDITERRHAEKMLLQSERLAAMGRLAASVAHEINNPLQSVQGCLTRADEELAGGQRQEKMARYLRIANGEIERIADIVRRMRDFYRPAVKGMQPTDIHTVLQSVLELANKQLQHSSVTVERRWAAELPRIEANADHLKQVLLNLVLNAMDAMPDGGTLQVQTALDQLSTRSGEAPQPAVRIEFSDTGQGMSPEHQIRLFEPFFTTKEHGSGLGLYISHGIITAHHGQISVVSYEGLGSTFSIILPVAQP
jgi:PAS domain S-box-containing protein